MARSRMMAEMAGGHLPGRFLGLFLFSPLGALAIYYGVRGWKKGQKRRGLAIAGFILGIIDVLIAIIILSLVLGI